MHIRQKLVLGWTVTTLLSVGIIGVVSFWITYTTLRQVSLDELNNVTNLVRITVRSVIDTSVQNYLRAVAEKNRDVVENFYQQYQGGVLTEVEAKQKIQEVILSHKIGKTGYNFVYDISDAPAHVICAIHPKVPGLDVAKYDFGQKAFAIKNGYFEYQWKNPDEDKPAKKAMYVAYFEPWQWLIASSSYKREFIHLVNQEELRKQLATINIGENGYVFIVDMKGNLIYHPVSQNENVYDWQDDRGNFFIRELIQQKTGNFRYRWKYKDSEQFAEKLAVLNFFEEIGWIAVSSAYEDDISKPLKKLGNTVILVTAGILLIGILAIILLVNSLTKPLIQMTHRAERLAEGDSVDSSIHIDEAILRNRDEVGNLARTFDIMVKKVELREYNLRRAEEMLREYNTTLEFKVRERTGQLEQANQDIQLLNSRLQSENLRMATELNITRQLQQMILPRAAELMQFKKLDIAGFMEPATEVGGDYYDVLDCGGHTVIGIGDVTGHGLASGVLMLMVQTAVRALTLNHACHLEECLELLNRTIYQNVQRMDTDKNLTLTLLDYDNGKLVVSGQHEEVIVIRQHGELERIDTLDLGFMIGVEPDISHLIASHEITLQPGDGIVLYTDGVTEAKNAQDQMYGIERLCKVLKQNRHLPAKELQQAVIADVKAHLGNNEIADDITLLVLKRR